MGNSQSTEVQTGNTELLKHINNKRWGEANSRAREHPHEVSTWYMEKCMAKHHSSGFCGFDSHEDHDDDYNYDHTNTNNLPPAAPLEQEQKQQLESMKKSNATTISNNNNSYSYSSGVMVRLLPLHRACELSAPLHLIQTLVTIFPEACKLKDHRNDWLPLHYCAATYTYTHTSSSSCCDDNDSNNNNNNNNNNDFSMNILNYILGQHTNAAKQKESLGRLPIHLACENGASKSSLQSLLSAYPDSVRCKDKDGQLPLHCACRSTYIRIHQRPHQHRSNGNGVVEEDADVEAFRVLLQACTATATVSDATDVDVVRMKDYSGKSCLDYMEENPHPNKRAILKLLKKKKKPPPPVTASAAHWAVSPMIPPSTGTNLNVNAPAGTNTNTINPNINPNPAETTSQSELYSAVLRQDWDRAISLAARRPSDAKVWYTMRDSDSTAWYRALPIHEACKLNPSFECIKALLLAYNAAYEVDYPNKCLPLHHVCEHGVSDVRVTKLLLKLNKGGTRCVDHHGMLPLHLVAWGGGRKEQQQQQQQVGNGDDEVVDLLLRIHGPAIRVRDRRGRTPVQIAQRRNNVRVLNLLVNFMYQSQNNSNNNAQQHYNSNPASPNPAPSFSTLGTFSFASKSTLTSTMSKMSKLSIMSVKTELYRAVSEKRWMDVIRIIKIDQHPEQANEWKLVQGHDGSILSRLLPIHLACQINPPDEVIAALLEASPQSVRAQGNASALPLHSACAHGASIGVVEMLLRAYPQSIHCKDAESRVPLDYARDSYHANKGVIIHALERDVSYWKQPNPQAPVNVSLSPDAQYLRLQQQQQQQQQQHHHQQQQQQQIAGHAYNSYTNNTNTISAPLDQDRPPPPPIPMQDGEEKEKTANALDNKNKKKNTLKSEHPATASSSLRPLEPISPVYSAITNSNNNDVRSHHTETVVHEHEHEHVPTQYHHPNNNTNNNSYTNQQQHRQNHHSSTKNDTRSSSALATPSAPTMSWGEAAPPPPTPTTTTTRTFTSSSPSPHNNNVLLQPQRALTPASISYNRHHKSSNSFAAKKDKAKASASASASSAAHHAQQHYNANIVIAPTESMEKTELFALAEKRNWNALIGRCNERPDEAATWYVVTNAQGQVISRMLPIHEACRRQPEELAIISLLNAYLDGVKQVDHSQRLPIHFACEHGANVTIVEAIRQYNPFGLAARDGRGMLPIHCCCWGGGSGRVISHLVKIFPKGLDEVDNFGRTPIMIALEGNHVNKIEILDALQPAY